MTKKINVEGVKKVTAPKVVDEQVLNYAKRKNVKSSNPHSLKRKFIPMALAYSLGVLTILGLAPNNNLRDPTLVELANSINLESLRMNTRSGGEQSKNIDLGNLSDDELKQIALALANKEQWQELEKLSIYIEKRRIINETND